MRLILARHAETGELYKGKYIGATDLPISPKGFKQADSLANRLDTFEPQKCLCSPMLRTRQTAEPICQRLQIGCEFHESLREINFGTWEKMSFQQISQRHPDKVSRWAKDGLDFQFPGGEKNRDFWQRVTAFAQDLEQKESSPFLIVSHGGVIRAMLCFFLGLSFDSYLLFDVQPARFAVLDIYENRGVLSGFNL